MKHVLIITACLMIGASSGVAQSTSSNFIKRDKFVLTSDQLKRNVVDRAKIVGNGWGAPAVRPASGGPSPSSRGGSPSPTTFAPVGPPRSRSASFGAGTGTSGSKPFENLVTRPTVSPYLGLFNEDLGGNHDLNYQTIVKPQLQQQQFNQQLARQTQAINQRMSAMAARNPYNARGSQNVMPTGHAATYNFHSRYYPGLSKRRR